MITFPERVYRLHLLKVSGIRLMFTRLDSICRALRGASSRLSLGLLRYVPG